MSTSYDRVPYPGLPYSQTHPDRLCGIATLFGLSPVPTDRCRVLELGCGDGSNLIPAAYQLPVAEFVGVDLSAAAIGRGLSLITSVGLSNITLLHGDLLDRSLVQGSFDYIVAHGLYSWVPGTVRDRLLEICGMHLASHGVAFVSYNCYPGGHIRRMMREMLLEVIDGIENPNEQLRQADAFPTLLGSARVESDAYSAIVGEEIERIHFHDPAALFHDELSPINHVVYFREFIDHAGAFGLQFLAESTGGAPTRRLTPDARVWLDQYAGGARRIEYEQALDFLLGRRFRRTLLCRNERQLCEPGPSHVTRFHIAANIVPIEPGIELPSTDPMAFVSPTGFRISVDSPVQKAALALLSERWPDAVSFDDLIDRVIERLAMRASADARQEIRQDVCDLVWQCYEAEVALLLVDRPRLTPARSAYPEVSKLARCQAAMGPRVTTLLHTTVHLDEPARLLVPLVDGTRSLTDLGEALRSAEGNLGSEAGERPERGESLADLDERLLRLARAGLLVK